MYSNELNDNSRDMDGYYRMQVGVAIFELLTFGKATIVNQITKYLVTWKIHNFGTCEVVWEKRSIFLP